MYWISKKHCLKVLNKVDRPMKSFVKDYSVQRIINAVRKKEMETVLVSYPSLGLLCKEDCDKNEYQMNSIWEFDIDYYDIRGEALAPKVIGELQPLTSSTTDDYEPETSDESYEDEESSVTSKDVEGIKLSSKKGDTKTDKKEDKKSDTKDTKSDKDIKKEDKKSDKKNKKSKKHSSSSSEDKTNKKDVKSDINQQTKVEKKSLEHIQEETESSEM